MKLAVVADEIGTTLEEQIKSMKLAKIKYIEMRDEDWSSKLTDEQLGINADKWVEKNELLKNECPKYGIRYIDTSKNRNKILQQIVTETEIDEM